MGSASAFVIRWINFFTMVSRGLLIPLCFPYSSPPSNFRSPLASLTLPGFSNRSSLLPFSFLASFRLRRRYCFPFGAGQPEPCMLVFIVFVSPAHCAD